MEIICHDEPVISSTQILRPVSADLKVKIATPIAKRLDVNNEELSPRKYFSEWNSQVSKTDYEFAVISIGRHNSIKQQIPEFSKNLGPVAILNLDQRFSEEEMKSQTNLENISVNYLKANIRCAERFCFIPPNKTKNHEEENSRVNQKELSNNIMTLIDSPFSYPELG